MSLLRELFKVAKELWVEAISKNNVCALIEQDGKFLAVSRKYNHSDLGLPGGGRNYAESEEEAIAREVFEETGASIKIERSLYSSKRTKTFLCTLLTAPILGVNEEKALVKWATREELESGTFGYYNRNLFQKVLK